METMKTLIQSVKKGDLMFLILKQEGNNSLEGPYSIQIGQEDIGHIELRSRIGKTHFHEVSDCQRVIDDFADQGILDTAIKQGPQKLLATSVVGKR